MGAVIKAARKNKYLTQTELARLVGIGVRHLIAIENEGQYPGLDLLYILIRALDISADQIFRPESVNRTIEDDLLIHTILSCNRDERDIITEPLLTLMEELEKKRTINHKQ